MNHLKEEQIWDILDGNASPEVQKQHEQLLQKDDEYRTSFKSFSLLHDQLCCLELDSPSMRFEQNLMERLQPSAQKERKTDRLPLIFLTTMSVLVAVLMLIVKNSAAPTTPIETSLLDKNTEGVISLISNPMFFYSFIVLNALLFFVILDKKMVKWLGR